LRSLSGHGSLLFLFPAFLLAAVTLSSPCLAHDPWPPIPPDELALKTNPAEPGAQAIILYREVERDDVEGYERRYYRLKIFTPEGAKYGDVAIPYNPAFERVTDIEARTVRPDGSVAPFDGQVFEKEILKLKGLQRLEKTFSLADVQPGSILEYRYTLRWGPGDYLPSSWMLQSKLYTRRAHFSIRPNLRGFFGLPVAFHWVVFRTGSSSGMREEKDNTHILDIENFPRYIEEPYMPPENEVRSRVVFFYLFGDWGSPEKFWSSEGKEMSHAVEKFMGKYKAVERLVRETISPQDSPEEKLRKLYARAQQFRNLSYEPFRTEKEEKEEKLKRVDNVDDIVKRGYGRGNEINEVFLAMARAAGFAGDIVMLADRDDGFFHPQLLSTWQLTAQVVAIRLAGKDIFLDPASRYCPFGLLPWIEAGAGGIELGRHAGQMIRTPELRSADTVTERKATLQLQPDGTLAGTIEASFTGQEAMARRRAARGKDDAGRRKQLADEIQGWLPAGTRFEAQSVRGWEDSSQPLAIEGTVRLPGFAIPAGRLLLVPLAVFETRAGYPFGHANRQLPIFFHYPYQERDDVTIHLPAGYRAEALPAARQMNDPFGTYQFSVEERGNALHAVRQVEIDDTALPRDDYPALREFFAEVKAGDGDDAVVQSAGKAAGD
jgi:Domain of Unknown Function with PDB structure (DUF3857)/Domain of Unknown Function with PDB structure (DUF3858)